MRPRRLCTIGSSAGLGLALLPGEAAAHFFMQPYNLPVPFTMYAFGASAALAVSFVAAGTFFKVPALARVARTDAGAAPAETAPGVCLMPVVSVFLLALCIVAGLFGSPDPFRNISMTLFWIGFGLALPYAVAVFGDFYAGLNPWHALARWLRIGEGAQPSIVLGRWTHVPALLGYMAFIWLELFGQLRPFGLAVALLVYTGINLVGAALLGRAAWFREGEFFGVMLRLLGALSPWARDATVDLAAPARWRTPFSGLRELPVRDLGAVLFILFMLSSTAFDGLHATAPWSLLFWKQVYPHVAAWVPTSAATKYAVASQLYYRWQWMVLLLSPLIYLGVYALFVATARRLAGTQLPLRTLLLRFAMSLVPIAFVYHVTHYYTLLLAQGGQLAKLVSDPLGLGWNLFGTARLTIAPWMVDVNTIWHTQVALILLGHIVSVCVAHQEALRLYGTPRQALRSQWPMLMLMMVFTTFGLWILSLPIVAS